MKKQTLLKKLHKPVHPALGNVILIGVIILIIVGMIALFLKQAFVSTPTLIRQSLPSSTPTPTSILAQSPNITPTLLPTNGWKTYRNYGYHFSVMLPPEIVPVSGGDAVFDPYGLNAFGFKEQGENGIGFSIAYNPAPSGTPAAYNQCVDMDTCYQIASAPYEKDKQFPLYSTVLGKRVKGVGWYSDFPANGGQKNRVYSYEYLVPVRTKGESLGIKFVFAELTPQQILTKQPLGDTILSTIKLED